MIDLSVVTNVITSLFCAAVLVQTVRLSRAVHKLRHAGLMEVVASLEAATATSQQALGELTQVLSAEGPPLDAAVRGARDLRAQLVTLRDELSLMIDVGNGVAERILAAANGARLTPRGTSDAEVIPADDMAAPASSRQSDAPRERQGEATAASAAAAPLDVRDPGRAGEAACAVRGATLATAGTTNVPPAIAEPVDLPADRPERAAVPFGAADKEPQS
ncbi:hypothetical protein KZ813_01795 [Sphingomonas sp. RHCKR7]|uniref:hypothetical protein n=1 Tax=Sphingomonas folli TaxID=2862497 RepID=UPI001CA5DA67|nr:hypothetical protein [Sphingomonas folli]MBW6525566.1 hypothetical protein [Sphingomonas folli]